MAIVPERLSFRQQDRLTLVIRELVGVGKRRRKERKKRRGKGGDDRGPGHQAPHDVPLRRTSSCRGVHLSCTIVSYAARAARSTCGSRGTGTDDDCDRCRYGLDGIPVVLQHPKLVSQLRCSTVRSRWRSFARASEDHGCVWCRHETRRYPKCLATVSGGFWSSRAKWCSSALRTTCVLRGTGTDHGWDRCLLNWGNPRLVTQLLWETCPSDCPPWQYLVSTGNVMISRMSCPDSGWFWCSRANGAPV